MSRKILLGCALTLTFALLPSAAFPQAAVEYSITTSGSATSAAKMGSVLSQGAKTMAGHVQRSMGKSLESPKGTANRSVNTMEENKKNLERKSRSGGGTVHIESAPGKATVLVDGSRVAYTPADLKIPNGKHSIEVNDPTHLTWRKEVTIAGGENLSFNPTLEEKYKSEMILSIQQ
ncbi:MAG TPA: PEGA domain-containing protein [Terriglobia bacterium]|nr:PEGA domain-containing protein [Terriglobia bacterium]